jgi:hypothetical protein
MTIVTHDDDKRDQRQPWRHPEHITRAQDGYPQSWSFGAFSSDYQRTWFDSWKAKVISDKLAAVAALLRQCAEAEAGVLRQRNAVSSGPVSVYLDNFAASIEKMKLAMDGAEQHIRLMDDETLEGIADDVQVAITGLQALEKYIQAHKAKQ